MTNQAPNRDPALASLVEVLRKRPMELKELEVELEKRNVKRAKAVLQYALNTGVVRLGDGLRVELAFEPA